VVSPELAKVINILFPGLNVPETNRTDIVQALLTGIPGVTQIAKKAPPTDTLKINLGTPPSATEKPFGVIGGDNAGFPNGRRLADDVTDIELRVVGGFLKGNKLPLGDCARGGGGGGPPPPPPPPRRRPPAASPPPRLARFPADAPLFPPHPALPPHPAHPPHRLSSHDPSPPPSPRDARRAAGLPRGALRLPCA
jgi:hypothetical protein